MKTEYCEEDMIDESERKQAKHEEKEIDSFSERWETVKNLEKKRKNVTA